MHRLSLTLSFVAFVMFSTSVSGQEASHIQAGHNLLQEGRNGTHILSGSQIEPFAFRDVNGEAFYLAEELGRGPAVFIVLSSKCPLAKRYSMRLKRLAETYGPHGVRFFGLFPNDDETTEGIRSYADASQCPFPLVRDAGGYVSRLIGATMTPQAFVVDRFSKLAYRGAIDDHRYENRVQQTYLADAIDAVVSGRIVSLPAVKSMGCTIHVADPLDGDKVTYSRHIARILQNHCQSCHRDGQVAPFALTKYEDAKRWQTEILEYTRSRLMPPWKATPGFVHYKNDMSLTDREVELIARWVDAGAPLGDETAVPPPPRFHDDWAFGEPDLIVEMPEEYVIGPEGEDDYRHFIVPYEADQDRFIEAIDVQPGNRNVVHHVIGYIDTSGKARELDAEQDGPGYTRFGDVGFKPASVIGGWAPGSRPIKTPTGTGRWLPKKCDIVLQVHYYRTGFEERDRTRIGVYFSNAEDPVAARGGVVINKDFVVPAGDSEFTVTAEHTIEQSSYLFSVTPHMHLIGETMHVSAHRPDGTVVPVIRIDDWDFNWQSSYHFRELQHLPAGTKVKLTATFDNSESNPNNPNSPPEDIGWGEKTTDEMCIAFLGLLHESEYDAKTMSRRLQPVATATKAE